MKKFVLFLLFLSPVSLSAKTIYCCMEYDWWHKDNSGTSCRAWNGSNENAPYPGIVMTKVEGEDYIWSIEIDDSYTHCMFVRCQGGTTEAVYFGSQTITLEIPNDDRNLFVITNEEYTPHGLGKNCEGYWSHYPAYDFYLVGKINGEDYSGDDYLFEEGSLLTTFTAPSYVVLKDQIGQWYYTEGWLGEETTTATFYAKPAEPNKFFVPGPSEVIFILYENPDGSFDLEYEVISTDLQSVSAEQSKARKEFIDGQFYIVRDGNMYNILGTQVK